MDISLHSFNQMIRASLISSLFAELYSFYSVHNSTDFTVCYMLYRESRHLGENLIQFSSVRMWAADMGTKLQLTKPKPWQKG